MFSAILTTIRAFMNIFNYHRIGTALINQYLNKNFPKLNIRILLENGQLLIDFVDRLPKNNMF